MQNMSILDCTLRDGGYVNDWNFGLANMDRIVTNLNKTNIDIIELGFISNKTRFSVDQSKFNSFEELEKVTINLSKNKMFVVMINYGEFNLDDIPSSKNTDIDGVRLAFHKKDYNEALSFAKSLKLKGYKLFIQAMVSSNYDLLEFDDLLKKSNMIDPFAFYIVDSFGSMKKNDLNEYTNRVKKTLNKQVRLGFHLHDNLQLALSNALWAIENIEEYSLIIDTSLLGLGRGAGNLKTELFYKILYSDDLNFSYITDLIEQVISPMRDEFNWGYSIEYVLSAIQSIHPNYATYLKTNYNFDYQIIENILKKIPIEFRVYYDSKRIDKIIKSNSYSKIDRG